MSESYKHLVGKLNFTRKKYYLHELLNGIFLFLAIIFLYLFVLSFLESILYLKSNTKTVLFFISLGSFTGLFIYFVLFPALRWLRIIKILSDKELSYLISKHFNEIGDKLLNVVELNELAKSELIQASIEQKSSELNRYNFEKAISFKYLKKKFIYLFLAVLFAFIFNVGFNNSLLSGLYRLSYYRINFSPPASFSFKLISEELKVKKGTDFIVKVKCEGKQVPDLLYINISGINYLMQQNDAIFEYELKHINNSFSFYFTDKIIQSNQYKLEVLPNPILVDYTVKIDPPDYTGLSNTEFKNIGDIEIPFGSEVNWSFKTVDVDSLSLIFSSDTVVMKNNEVNHQFFTDENYAVNISNQYFSYPNILNFKAQVLPDYFPEIELVQLKDSLNFTRFFFKGSIHDDYGFNDLTFHIYMNKIDTVFEIPIIHQLTDQEFYYTFDFSEMVKPGQKAHYYFEVADNDPFNGFKKTSSQSFEFIFPDQEKLLGFENESISELEQLLNQSQKISQDIQESIKELKFKNFSGNSSSWEKQQLANEIVNKKNQLENILRKIEDKNKLMNQFLNSFSDEKKEILQKQKELEQLLDEVLSDELKELFEEFNKLANDFQSDEFNKLDDKYELSLDDLSKQLERNLQALKRMKVEQKLERLAEFLNELSLSELANSNKLQTTKNFDEISKSENENKSLFEAVEKELEQLFELNNSMKKPLNIPHFDEENNIVNSIYDQILKNLSDKRKKKSVDSILENSRQLQTFSGLINQVLEQNRQKQNFENIDNIRQILDNLIFLSFEQEKLLIQLNSTGVDDPQMNKLIGIQDNLIEQTEHVKDSLYALSNRTVAIGNVVNKELVDLRYSMSKSKDELIEDKMSNAKKLQQSSITSLNNIALFLNEILKNLEKQMANSMPGDQQCDKPSKGGEGGFNMLKQAQESLKQQLQQMIEQMKSGNPQNMSKQLGQALSQQEMMQQMIRDLINSEEVGSSSKQQLKQIDQLIEDSKIDIINNTISQQTINRQNLILDRLLKAEKAELEREIDDKRDSKTAEEKFYSNPAAFFEYKKNETKFNGHLFKKKYSLKKFYQDKYREYINELNNKN